MDEKWYIAGMVTGRSREDVELEFCRVSHLLRSNGIQPINPIDLVPESSNWLDAMRLCISAMMDATAVIRLAHWKYSRGAKIEVELAEKLGIKVIDLEQYEHSCKR